jgi:hypothetical protein
MLIASLPVPEPEAEHVARLAELQNELATANEEYRLAVNRASMFFHRFHFIS